MHQCVIHISGGDPERFLNLCKNGDIPLSSVYHDETGVFATIPYNKYDTVKKYEEKCRCKCSIVMEKGVVTYLQKYKKHVAFVLSCLAFSWLLYYSSLFVWHVDVVGESDYTKEEIIKYVTDSLVPLGTKRKQVHPEDLEKQLRMQYDQIAWVTCEVDGTRLIIHLVETVTKENVEKITKPCNIVAVKDGLITESIATNGTKLVNPGDEVKKGDVLITGVVNIYNEYEELIETNYVPADGIVYGKTTYQYRKEFPLSYTKRVQGKKKKCAISVRVGSKVNKIFKPEYKDGYEKVEKTYPLHIGHSYYLPIAFVIGNYYKPEYTAASYTEDEACLKQKAILQNYLDDLKKKGVEILENNVTIVCKDGKCVASGTILVREMIGAPEIFVIPESVNTENDEE